MRNLKAIIISQQSARLGIKNLGQTHLICVGSIKDFIITFLVEMLANQFSKWAKKYHTNTPHF